MGYTAYQNNKDSREPKARMILEKYAGLNNLRISDRPDITDGESVGVEVVNALPEDEIKELSRQEKEVVVNNNKDFQLSDGVYCCDLYRISTKCIWLPTKLLNRYIDLFAEKTLKLNESYKCFPSNRLFFFGNHLLLDDDVLEVLASSFNRINEKYEINYDIVYIYIWRKLFIINLKNSKTECINDINDSELEFLSLQEFNKRTYHKT